MAKGQRESRDLRTFGGRSYYSGSWNRRKVDAQRTAQEFRKRGYLARVVKDFNPGARRWGYMVYLRGK